MATISHSRLSIDSLANIPMFHTSQCLLVRPFLLNSATFETVLDRTAIYFHSEEFESLQPRLSSPQSPCQQGNKVIRCIRSNEFDRRQSFPLRRPTTTTRAPSATNVIVTTVSTSVSKSCPSLMKMLIAYPRLMAHRSMALTATHHSHRR